MCRFHIEVQNSVRGLQTKSPSLLPEGDAPAAGRPKPLSRSARHPPSSANTAATGRRPAGTADNGIEFMDHRKICRALDCTVYFADPYCPGQKGGGENINKILREFFPKGTDFREVDQSELNRTQYMINERPRKKLGFSTPKKEFFKRIA